MHGIEIFFFLVSDGVIFVYISYNNIKIINYLHFSNTSQVMITQNILEFSLQLEF